MTTVGGRCCSALRLLTQCYRIITPLANVVTPEFNLQVTLLYLLLHAALVLTSFNFINIIIIILSGKVKLSMASCIPKKFK